MTCVNIIISVISSHQAKSFLFPLRPTEKMIHVVFMVGTTATARKSVKWSEYRLKGFIDTLHFMVSIGKAS